MKYIIIFIATVTLFSCASSNKVSANKASSNKVSANKASSKKANTNKISATKISEANQVADNSRVVCRTNRKTGSRINTKTCITKEQDELERKRSVEMMRRSNTQKNLVPGATGPN
jgi:hypothetical protein